MNTEASKLTARELAPLINRSVPTLERWRRLRIGPPFLRVCGRVLYDPADVDAWFEAQKQATENTPERAPAAVTGGVQ